MRKTEKFTQFTFCLCYICIKQSCLRMAKMHIKPRKGTGLSYFPGFCIPEFAKVVMLVAKLTQKQQLFVNEYLVDLNATQAAIRAGYSVKTAAEQGSRLLTNVKIQDAIEEEMAKRSRRTGITQDRVLQELARIAFVNPNMVIDAEDGSVREGATEDDLASIQGVKVKKVFGEKTDSEEREIKFHDKLRALELLGKHLGMFKDKVELSADVDVKNPYEGLTTEELRRLISDG